MAIGIRVGAAASRRATRSARLLACLLATAGITHFLAPGQYDAIVPHPLPGRARWWTWIGGAAELACALAVAHPRTRRRGASAAAVLFVLVFPANVQMAIDWRHRAWPAQLLAYARLPLQIPLVWWALATRRRTPVKANPHPASP